MQKYRSWRCIERRRIDSKKNAAVPSDGHRGTLIAVENSARTAKGLTYERPKCVKQFIGAQRGEAFVRHASHRSPPPAFRKRAVMKR